jgi:hypothetical protein
MIDNIHFNEFNLKSILDFCLHLRWCYILEVIALNLWLEIIYKSSDSNWLEEYFLEYKSLFSEDEEVLCFIFKLIARYRGVQ